MDAVPPFSALVRCDLTRHFGRHSALLLLRAVVLERTFRVVLTLRICQALAARKAAGKLLLPVAVVLHRMASASAGVDLPWRTRIGAGFRLFHGWSAVLNPGAVLGTNVSIFHGVTIGQGDRIAAGAVVTEDVPPASMAAGNPAQVVRTDVPPDVENRTDVGVPLRGE